MINRKYSGSIKKALFVFIAIIISLVIIFFLPPPLRWEIESIPSDAITLFEVIPYATEYLEKYQGDKDWEVIEVRMDISSSDHRGRVEIVYALPGKTKPRFVVSIDTVEGTLIGSVADARGQRSELSISQWTIDSDEIVDIAHEYATDKVGEFEYSIVNIGSSIGKSDVRIIVYFVEENRFVDNTQTFIDPFTGNIIEIVMG